MVEETERPAPLQNVEQDCWEEYEKRVDGSIRLSTEIGKHFLTEMIGTP